MTDSLVGRERELEAVARALAPGTLVTVTGLGGSGKTTLAAAVATAERAAGRPAHVVDLAPVLDPGDVAAVIAASVAARERAGVPLEDALVEALAREPGLLVLDNLEHLPGATSFVGRLVARASSTALLATSRASLGIDGEREIQLLPLRVPAPDEAPDASPAGELFVRRSVHVAAWTANDTDAVGDVCRALDGLPLAIEMAAAWTSVLTPRAIRRRLDDQALELGGTTARHDRLDRVILASRDLLEPDARRAFATLGAFLGPFDEPAARAVLDTPEALAMLRAHALVGLVQVKSDGAGEPVFRLLETVRVVAVGELEAGGTARTARDRHARHYAAVAEAASDRLRERTFGDPEALARLLDPNVSAAYAHAMAVGDGLTATRIATGMASGTIRTGSLTEGVRRLVEAIALGPVPDALRADALNALVSMRANLGEVGQVADSQAAVDAARASGDPRRVARTLVTLGNEQQGPERVARLREGMVVAAADGYRLIEAIAGLNLGYAYLDDDAPDEAMQALEAAASAYTRSGDPLGLALANGTMGDAHAAAGREEDAIASWEAALPILRAGAPPQFWTAHLTGMAVLRSRQGDRAGALAALAELADLGRTAETAATGGDLALAAAVVLADRHPVVACRAQGRLGSSAVPASYADDLTGSRDASERALGSARAARERRAGARQDAGAMAADVMRALDRERSEQLRRQAGAYELLTPRELEVARLLADGRSDSEIATALGTSPKTASVHVSNVKAKLGAATRVEAALAVRRVLDSLGDRMPA